MKYTEDAPAGEAFSDKHLTPRARRMAEWLCDLSNRALDRRNRQVSGEMLLRELPDHWTGDDLWQESMRILRAIGSKQPRTAWLSQMGWLVGQEERLPQAMTRQMSEFARMSAQRSLRTALGKLTRKVTEEVRP